MSRPVVRQWKSCWKWASWGVYFETALQLHSIVIFRKVLFQKMEFCNRKHVAGQRRRLKPKKKKKQQKQREEKGGESLQFVIQACVRSARQWWIRTLRRLAETPTPRAASQRLVARTETKRTNEKQRGVSGVTTERTEIKRGALVWFEN